jgi:hypothetical protein
MWPIQLAFCLLISRRIFLSSLTLSNISSFLMWSVQLISILLQYHNSTFSRCFWSTVRSVQVSAPYRPMTVTLWGLNYRSVEFPASVRWRLLCEIFKLIRKLNTSPCLGYELTVGALWLSVTHSKHMSSWYKTRLTITKPTELSMV